MPEGHVLHRLARQLNDDFRGRPLEISSPQGRFAREASLIDATPISGAFAHGKHLFVEFGDSAFRADQPARTVYIHLGLIGSLRFEPASDEEWGQIRLRISNGETAAHLRGPQACALLTDAEVDAIIDAAGFDPLAPGALSSPDELFERVHRSKRTIGSLLMDQKLFAGVGNIYRAEVLFRQGLDPSLSGRDVSRTEFDDMWADLVDLMSYGVEHGRIDTVRPDHTPEAMERPPRKDDHGGEVYVYRRAGEPCHVCGTPIATKVAEGRKLYWCPHCQ